MSSSDNLAAILDGWPATLRQLAAAGNRHAEAWADVISAEPMAGHKVIRFGEQRIWLLGIEVPGVPGIGKPPPSMTPMAWPCIARCSLTERRGGRQQLHN
jgi:hypothetical protein